MPASEAKKFLTNQIVVKGAENDTSELTNEEQIVKFLNQHSKIGKTFKEIELIGENLSCNIYKIVGLEREIAIKVPKKVPDSEQATLGFLDLIFQMHLVQVLQGTSAMTKNNFFANVLEEIFELDPSQG